MAKKKGGSHGGGGGGHDGGGSLRWLLTYADMITLLTAFFIMMYSMSVVNIQKFDQVAISIRSGFGGQLKGAGQSVLGANGGGGVMPSILNDAKIYQSAHVVKQMKGYIGNKGLGGDLRVHMTERGLIVTLVTDKMLFLKGQADITPRAGLILDKVASLVRNAGPIRVEGHTDDLPIHTARYPSNWELSAARATTVARFLMEHSGVESRRMSVAAYADTHPLAPNDSETHRAYNRRVDLVILNGDKPTSPSTPARLDGSDGTGKGASTGASSGKVASGPTKREKAPASNAADVAGP